MDKNTIDFSQARLQKFEDRLSHLETEMIGVKARITELTEGQGQILALIGGIQQTIARVDGRLDSIDVRLSRIENRLDLMES